MARDPFEIPVVLMYDHEKEPEAIDNAAPDIANRVGVLMDGVLGGLGPAARCTSSTCAEGQQRGAARRGIYFVMVDRFANGDRSNDGDADLADPQAFHGGDLQGVIDHLDWIQGAGLRHRLALADLQDAHREVARLRRLPRLLDVGPRRARAALR